jgi:hypothetical protein
LASCAPGNAVKPETDIFSNTFALKLIFILHCILQPFFQLFAFCKFFLVAATEMPG